MASDKITHESLTYNWEFYPDTEDFCRWGSSKDDDATFAIIGPEHLDIEVSTVCDKKCNYCYTKNSDDGVNMSFDTFKAIFDMVNSNLITVHLNIGGLGANPYIPDMLKYMIERNVVPSITIPGGFSDESQLYDIAMYCGHVNVSNNDKNACIETIIKLIWLGVERVNMRLMFSDQTSIKCYTAISDIDFDRRLEKVNGVIIDTVRPQNRGKEFTPPTEIQLRSLMSQISFKRIPFSVSHCLGYKIQELMKTSHPDLKSLALDSEPCEAGLFRGYINIHGVFYPCPFMEFEGVEGIPILDKDNFVKDVWNHPTNKEWRDQLMVLQRECPIFK